MPLPGGYPVRNRLLQPLPPGGFEPLRPHLDAVQVGGEEVFIAPTESSEHARSPEGREGGPVEPIEGVTPAPHTLEGAGMIRAKGGPITVLGRAKLREAAGGGYRAAEAEYERPIASSRGHGAEPVRLRAGQGGSS